MRTIYHLDVIKDRDIVTIRVTGSGFLYHMVRIIAGTLLQAGTGERVPEEIPDILKAHSRSAAGPTAPAHGLTNDRSGKTSDLRFAGVLGIYWSG